MNDSVVKQVLLTAINELEESGEIVVIHPSKRAIVDKLFAAVQEVSPNLLSSSELGGIINALNAHQLGFGLGDNDFHSVIGLTKEELTNAAAKLKLDDW